MVDRLLFVKFPLIPQGHKSCGTFLGSRSFEEDREVAEHVAWFLQNSCSSVNRYLDQRSPRED